MNATFKWIDAESVLEEYERLQTDARQHLPEHTTEWDAWLNESAEAETEVIRAYLYTYVHPAQLPAFIEELIVNDEYEPEQLAEIIEEVRKGARCHAPVIAE